MSDGDNLARALHRQRFARLERRRCTKDAPMPEADKDRFMWGHPDAVEVGTFFNLIMCECPHCKLRFTCFPP